MSFSEASCCRRRECQWCSKPASLEGLTNIVDFVSFILLITLARRAPGPPWTWPRLLAGQSASAVSSCAR
eukprot:16434290-Heterocapsa_arctica.AAC.1